MTKRHQYSIAVAFVALAVGMSDASAMSLEFTWAGYQACSKSSPAFIVSDVPAATRHLKFKMVDENVPTYRHGGGTVAYSGTHRLPAGAFSYRGPCPPSGQQHVYEWTVQALDRNGKTLASASARAKFPPR
jgi:phosphatidylethanolamine-binding protein (PEBP) family uncharacterized protein